MEGLVKDYIYNDHKSSGEILISQFMSTIKDIIKYWKLEHNTKEDEFILFVYKFLFKKYIYLTNIYASFRKDDYFFNYHLDVSFGHKYDDNKSLSNENSTIQLLLEFFEKDLFDYLCDYLDYYEYDDFIYKGYDIIFDIHENEHRIIIKHKDNIISCDNF